MEDFQLERRKNTILLVSFDPRVSSAQKDLLESQGLQVVVLTGSGDVKAACREHRPRLLMIGYTVPLSEKRRIWLAARRLCKVPVVELTHQGVPEPSQESFFVYPEPSTSFVRKIKEIMKIRE